jgi:hypothetical protein
MTRQELQLKAKEFDSKLERHPMSSEELQNVLCDFVEALRIHDVISSVCNHPEEALIRDKPTPYCLACNKNIPEQTDL